LTPAKGITALASALVLVLTAGAAVAENKNTLDPKRIAPISSVDNGDGTKTVTFYYQEATYDSRLHLPHDVDNDAGELFLAAHFMSIGQSVNYLGTYQATSRYRAAIHLDDTCSSYARFKLRGVFTMSNEEGSLTFAVNGGPGGEPCAGPGEVHFTLTGAGRGNLGCVDHAQLVIDLRDDIQDPALDPEGLPEFFQHQYFGPTHPLPDENKVIIELTGPTDCAF
jgi:hypothetical protein